MAEPAEGARLLSEYMPKRRIEGSNPSLSAIRNISAVRPDEPSFGEGGSGPGCVLTAEILKLLQPHLGKVPGSRAKGCMFDP